MTLFEVNEVDKEQAFSLDERLNPETVVFVIFLFNTTLDKITLTTSQPFFNTDTYKFGIINDELFVNGSKIGLGLQALADQMCFVVSKENAETSYFICDETKDFIFGIYRNFRLA